MPELQKPRRLDVRDGRETVLQVGPHTITIRRAAQSGRRKQGATGLEVTGPSDLKISSERAETICQDVR